MPPRQGTADSPADSVSTRPRRRIAMVAASCCAVVAAGCGSSPTVIRGASDSNGGVIVVSEAATYRYALSICAHNILRLRSDSGQADDLTGASGQLYLGLGNWTGTPGVQAEAFEPTPDCRWSVTLTSAS